MWVMTLCEDYKCVTFWDVILDKEVTLQRRIRDNESLKCYLAPHMHFKNNPKAQEKVNSIKEILHKWREIQLNSVLKQDGRDEEEKKPEDDDDDIREDKNNES